MSNLSTQKECEICLELEKHSPANRELDGVWVCVDCIVRINGEEISKSNPPRSDAVSIAKRVPTTNAKNLAVVLAQTMEGLLDGKIDCQQALAICKVSSEAVKVLDLIWRMNR